MPKTRKIHRRAKTHPPRQGNNGPQFTQSPKHSGIPRATNPPKATMRNTSMTKPGSGTHGTGKGAH